MKPGDAIDEGWDDDAPNAEAPARALADPPPGATADAAGSEDVEANEAQAGDAEKIDTAKSRVVRLVDKPVRSDPLEEPPPPSARDTRTVPPPADYDVVRQTAKHKAFDLDAALERKDAAQGHLAARGAGPAIRVHGAMTAPPPPAYRAGPPAVVDAPLPEAPPVPTIEVSPPPANVRSDHVTKSAFARDDESSAPARPRRRFGLVVAVGTLCVAAGVVASFAMTKRGRAEDGGVATRASAAQASSPPTASASSATAPLLVAGTAAAATAAADDATISPAVAAAAAPKSPAATARSERAGTSPVHSATSASAPPAAPTASSRAPSTAPAAPAASTPAAKGAPGVEFLKRNL